ncbi:MAG: iron ABC transporter permease [Alphaproteobacteria bacterium]|nr:iron ABC transporter permease [Alphaproteobacteria bacterium]
MTIAIRADAPVPAPRRGPAMLVAGLAALLGVVAVVSIGIGPFGIAPGRVGAILLDTLLGGTAPADRAVDTAVLLGIRLPRIALGIAVGAVLALAGAVMQGLFRNPLADPGVLGVSSGAAVGAVGMIVLGERLPDLVPRLLVPWLQPTAAFLAGLAATAFVYAVARRGGAARPTTMLLAGIAVNAMAGAATGFFTFMSGESQLRMITFWTMGSLGHGSWGAMLPALLPLALSPVLLFPLARRLDVLLLGEREAGHLGVDPERVRRRAGAGVALGVGAAVALTGVIGFVGIVAPHVVRLLIGPAHRALLPAAALGGAILLLLADIAARMALAPAELPIGLVTALVGGPFFLWLLLRRGPRAC